MSERLKFELADELGIGDVVRRDEVTSAMFHQGLW